MNPEDNNKLFQKRVSEMVTDIFPLDRLLPLESAYLIFEQEYKKSNNKNFFFKDRKFQRLREGYFSIFVAMSLQDISKKTHYLVFPSNPQNDVYITYKIGNDKPRPKFVAYEFDIKEFTDYSQNFEEFAKEKIIPRINTYNIAIPTYRKMVSNDIQFLINYLKSKNLNSRIWILGLPPETNDDYAISDVTILSKNGIIYEKIIRLDEWIDKNKTPFVFHDGLHFKSFPPTDSH